MLQQLLIVYGVNISLLKKNCNTKLTASIQKEQQRQTDRQTDREEEEDHTHAKKKQRRGLRLKAFSTGSDTNRRHLPTFGHDVQSNRRTNNPRNKSEAATVCLHAIRGSRRKSKSRSAKNVHYLFAMFEFSVRS